MFLGRADLIRANNNGISSSLITIDLRKILENKGLQDNITLRANDLLRIYSKSTFKSEINVQIVGAVKKPGVYVYKENMYLLELGKEFRDRMKLENEKVNEKKEVIPVVDPQYERMAEKLGGYPDNLILDKEKSLEELLKLNFARGSLNARVNKASFVNL